MFVAIVGTQFSGRTTIERFLIEKHNFRKVEIQKNGTSIWYSLSRTLPKNIPAENVTQKQLLFSTADSLLEYATQHWLESFVTCDLNTPALIEPFIKRPFFLVISTDAPLLIRFNRIRQIYPNHTLEEFITQHDSAFYGSNNGLINGSHLRQLFRMAHINVLNTFDTLQELYSHLEKLDITNQDRLRPQWDTYFMTLASLASLRSNCMKRRVGAILVRDRRILSTGYNGTPRNVRNCNEGGCKRCNSGVPSGQSLDDCLCLHAEENALLEAGRERVGVGSVLYCNTCPCLGCAIKIVQTGVKEVVYNLSYRVDDRTEALFKEADVVLRQHSPPELE